MCDVALRHIHVTIVAVEEQQLLNIMSTFIRFCLSGPASKLHLSCTVLYSHLWPVRLYNIFPHYLINGKIFGEKLSENKMCVLIFSTIFAKTFLIPRRFQGDIIINVDTCLCEVSDIIINVDTC